MTTFSQNTKTALKGSLPFKSAYDEIATFLNVTAGTTTASKPAVPDTNKRLDVLDVTNLKMNAVPQATTATLTPATGTTNQTLVSIQLKDGAGNALATTCLIDIWLSDASTGIGVTTTAASGTVGAGTSGTVLLAATATAAQAAAVTAGKYVRGMTSAAGLFILAITDSSKTGYYVACGLPSGTVVVSSQLTSGSYG